MSLVESEADPLSHEVIGAAIEVHPELGPGFLEATYAKALQYELGLRGIPFESEVPVSLEYKGHPIGDERVDLLVGEKLVIELKACGEQPEAFRRQVAAYLKATGLDLGLVINFHHITLKEGIARVMN